VFQFQVHAANTTSVTIRQPQGFSPVFLRPNSHSRLWTGLRFEKSSRTSFFVWEGGGRGEKTACHLNAGLSVKVLKEVGDPPKWRLTLWGRGCWDSLFGTGWLEFHHRHFRTSGLALTSLWDSLPLDPSSCVGWSGCRTGRSLSLDYAAASDIVVPARAKFLLFGRSSSWSWFGSWQPRGDAALSAALPLLSLCSSRLCFFPLTATTIVCSVVSSAAAALKLLLWSDTLPSWVLVIAGHTPRCISEVTLRVSKTLAAYTMQRPLLGVVRL
jgi:hypothetical protein